ncbi:hypothetical protein MNBD_GAMMA01-1286 [hydrothermal vent metagenome]|uniref:Uncharacterized protein n=1 Tax=hydrothermal vent metagenome TaxID=652676 RepID=A0A3B0V449_9ZZZZ
MKPYRDKARKFDTVYENPTGTKIINDLTTLYLYCRYTNSIQRSFGTLILQ